jgi:hypothetical protein
MEQFKEFHKELERLKTSGFSTGELKKVCQNSVKDINLNIMSVVTTITEIAFDVF